MRLIAYLITMLLLTSIAPALASIGTVARSIPDTTPGESLTVSLNIDVETASYYIIEEFVPSGWTITSISGGGTSEVAGRITWHVSSGVTDTTYTYTVNVPPDVMKSHSKEFMGTYRMKGNTTERTIEGDFAPRTISSAKEQIGARSGTSEADIMDANQRVRDLDQFRICDVSPGSNTIRLVKPGYENYTETVHVSARDTVSVSAHPTATTTPTTVVSTPTPTGYIRAWSSPSGADIYLDDVYQGVTGLDWFWIYDVSTGYCTIRLEKSGYEDYTEAVYVSAGDTASVSAYLTATTTPTTAVSTPTPTGYIRAWSSPSGADIYLDDVHQGVTCPDWFWIYDVSTGYCTIRLEKSGYEDYTEAVYVSAGDTASVSAYLTATTTPTTAVSTPTPTGYIRAWSSPSEADIYLDDVYQGVTGLDWFWIYDVSTGYCTIRLEKSGYEDYTEAVYVSAGDTASVSAYLTATTTPTTAVSTPTPTGYIRAWSSPSGADIYLDDVHQGVTCPDWFWIYDVSPGSHTIKLTKSGYENYTATVHVSAGDTGSIEATLTKKTGSISIYSSPSGADIYLDGTYEGTTPATISDASPGSHKLKLEKYGYAEWLTSVHVTSGVTGSITAHLTAADVSPPAIRIDKPTIIEYNNNELLEEGEKVEITYGANDPSGVTSIKIMLDGITLESQNQAGTYTVSTNSLSVGEHTIKVRATDSKSNRGFEELPITVERTGPSVYFGTTRTTIKKGEDAIFTLSAVNPIGNPPMTVQLILKPPTGVSVTSSSFAKAGSGIYTCTQTIKSGDNLRSIEVHLTGNEVGAHEIESEVYYQFRGSPKSPTRYDTLILVVEQDTRSADSEFKTWEIVMPGFGMMIVIIGLLAAYLSRIRT